MSNLQDIEQRMERLEFQVFNNNADNDKIKFAIDILEKARKLLIYEWGDFTKYSVDPDERYCVAQTNRVINNLINEIKEENK